MDWGKLTSYGGIKRPGTTLVLPDGRTMTNYRKEVIEDLGFTLEQTMEVNGYKPLVEVDRPADEAGFYFTSSWEDQDDQIIQVWTKHELPADPDPVVTESSEIDKILMGVYD